MKNNLLALGILFLCIMATAVVHAQQDGLVDTDFGSNGIQTISAGSNDNLKCVTFQSDGKMLVAGSAYNVYNITSSVDQLYIGRRNADGSVDGSFGTSGGYVIIRDTINAQFRQIVAQTPSGGIVYAFGQSSAPKPMVGRLSANGTSVFSVGPYAVAPASYYQNVTCMSYNKTSDKMVVGGYANITDYNMFFSKHGAVAGAFDTDFGTAGKLYMDNPYNATYKFSKCREVIALDDGTTLVAGITTLAVAPSPQPALTVAKLKLDGSLETTFGSSGISRYTFGSTTVSMGTMAIDADGKIVVAGSSNDNFAIYRLNSDGSADASFNATPFDYSSTTDIFNSIYIQPDKKIIVCGTASVTTPPATYGIVARYMPDGTLDASFGTNGIAVISGMQINACAFSTADKRLILAGKNASSNKMMLYALKVGGQKFNILGKDIVSTGTENSFAIHPYSASRSYYWSYSNPNIYVLGPTNKDTVTYYFNNATPSGTLSCTVFNAFGQPIATVTKNIKISTEPTLAEQLTTVQCDPAQTYDEDNYINSFSIRQTKISSSNTGASATGYSDLTAAGYDTVYIGDNYQATIGSKSSAGVPMYCGLWIDLNNNGKLNDPREFVGSTVSENNSFTINNIVVPVESGSGPKRVRVRVRPAAPFTANDFCMVNEELSETEDYLVVLSDHKVIEAPNFITPNNDGKNDNFIVRGIKDGAGNSLKVFNRIGDLVYDKENYDNSWGGADKNGGQLKPGTYYYVFTQPNADKGEDDVVKGFFEIRY